MKFFTISFLLLLFSGTANAANHYIRAGAGGSANGNDWTNACTDFTGSCAVASLTRGDTYYIADGSYASRTFSTACTSCSTYITIQKAVIADHGTSTGWSDTYGDGVADVTSAMAGWGFTTSYWKILGVSGSANGARGILIKCTSCYSGSNDDLIVLGAGVTHLTFDHIETSMVSCLTDETDGPEHYEPFYGPNGGSDLTITNSYLHGSCWSATLLITGWTNVLVDGDYIEDAHYKEVCACRDLTGLTFRNNFVKNTSGTGFIVFDGGSNNAVYNNVFIITDAVHYHLQNGYVVDFTTPLYGNLTNVYVYGNTFYMADGTPNAADAIGFVNANGTIEIENNLVYNPQTNFAYRGVTPTAHDYNYCYSSPSSRCNTITAETHSQGGISGIFTNIGIDNFTLASATNDGIHLSSPFNVDILGASRGADGVWDMGAYEYTGSKMVLIPTSGLSSSGFSGGSFSPDSAGYTLTNTEGNTISWSVTSVTQPTPSWLTFSATTGTVAGTIQNPSDSDSVTVSINSNANALSSGVYNDTITWTNATDNAGTTTTSVTLTVNLIGGGGRAVNGRNSVGVRSRPAVSGRTPVAGRRNH